MKKTVYGGRDIIAMNSLGRNHLWILLCVVIGLLLMVPAMAGAAEVHFSIPEGEYDGPQELTISCDPGWQICYTTDGSEPVENVGIYGSEARPRGFGFSNPVTFTVSDSCLIKAVAFKSRYKHATPYDFSSIATQLYTIKGSKVLWDGMLKFSPRPDAFQGSQDVIVSGPEGWTICYTTDGSDPIMKVSGYPIQPHGSGYSNPVTIPVSESCVIKAVAYKRSQNNIRVYTFSNIAVQSYTSDVQDNAVQFSLRGGSYIGAQEVVLSCDPDWKICYTTDGSSPIKEKNGNNYPHLFRSGNPVTVTLSHSCTIRAVAYRMIGFDGNGEKYEFSNIAEQGYYIVEPDYSLSLYAPVFDSVYEEYSLIEPEPLTIVSTGNSDATITSVALSGPDADCFVLNKTDGMMISAGGIDNVSYSIGLINGLAAGTYSATVTAAYNGGKTVSAEVICTVNEWDAAAAPVISPNAGTYSSVQQVELFCSTEDASIYYTTDGTDPDSTGNGTLYTGPISVFTDTTIKAIAIKPGLRRSLITEAAYTMDLTLFYGLNDVFLGAEYQPVSFHFTPPDNGVYRFYSDDQDISPSITVYDGDNQIEYHTGAYQPHNCIAELEGGKEYTVKVESWHGTGNIKVLVNPTTLYPIYAEPSDHGSITVSQGALPADDGNTIGMAYAGADVYFEASPDDGYGLADVSVVNAIGRVISRDLHTIMLWGNVTVRANFDTVHSLSWEQDEHARFDTIWINGGGMGAWGEDREVVKGQKVQLSWECDEGFVADTFTVTTASGAAPDWTFGLDNDKHQVIEFTMPGEDVHVSLTSRGFSFDSADLVLPADTKTVEQNAFEGDAQLTSVVIPAGCESIADMAFKNCANLRYIRIPEGCAVGRNTFYGCRQVYIYGKVNSPAWEYCQAHDNCEFVDEAAAAN